MPPVQGQTGGSAQSPCSWAHSRKGRVFSGAWVPLGGRRMCWISACSSARLKSFPRGPGHLHAKMWGSACDGFLLSLVGRGRTEMDMDGCKKHRMARADVKAVACRRYLCFDKEKRGRWRVRLGTNTAVSDTGCGPKKRMPAMAASVAASTGLCASLNPHSMRVLSRKERKAATGCSGCGRG